MRAGGACSPGPGTDGRRARPPARGRRPLHPPGARVARRSTSAPASAPASPSRPPRRVAASAVRRAAVTGEQPRRRARLRPAGRRRRPRAARSSSRRPRRAASSRCSRTCCARRPPTPSAPGSPALDLSGLQGRFDEGATVETGDLVPGRRPARPARHRCPAWRSCCSGSASRRSRPASPPRRWSSPSRACTSTAGWPRTRSAAGPSTAADVDRRPTTARRPGRRRALRRRVLLTGACSLGAVPRRTRYLRRASPGARELRGCCSPSWCSSTSSSSGR